MLVVHTMSDQPATCPYPFPSDDLTELARNYARLRAHAPVPQVTLRSGDTAYLVTRYADALAVLGDRRFSPNLDRPEAARLREGAGNHHNPYTADPDWHRRW